MEDKKKQLVLSKETFPETEISSLGMLKEFALKWFTETQAPMIMQNGTLPEWFHGLITRKDAEELLKDKGQGCFLFRLSDKAIGYILSYRGKDRCRHFIINQLSNGYYIISGDNCSHKSLGALIKFYQTSKIEPFGENLTTSCMQDKNVYDKISFDMASSLHQKKLKGENSSNPPTQEAFVCYSATLLKKEFSSSPLVVQQYPASLFTSKKTLPEQQQHLPKERRNASAEDSDLGPPLPERSSLLMNSGLKETNKCDLKEKGNVIYAQLNKTLLGVRNFSLETSSSNPFKMPSCTLVGSSSEDKRKDQKETDKARPVQAKNMSTLYSQSSHKGDCKTFIVPEIVYSEINLQHDRSSLSPTTPSKLSPKLTSQTRTSLAGEPSDQQFATYATSLKCTEGFKKPNGKNLYDTCSGCKDKQIHQSDSLRPPEFGVRNTTSTCKQIPAGCSKPAAYDHDSGQLPKSPSTVYTRASAYEQIAALNSRASTLECQAEDTYEKIPESPSKCSTTDPDNTYEQLPLDFLKVAQIKLNPVQKHDKRRRFFFADRKNK
ncbi:SH2 domain-containing protein 7 [Rhinatrema bivittatum]|uniref:SH2 domain-containing protein 7 n=1 Tax=Rhinatrema bivittatum TaxID=194408 RepID=UPI00112D633E|nr:SH2 domain-containing protein 7 [Rhinatrema bivittatum]